MDKFCPWNAATRREILSCALAFHAEKKTFLRDLQDNDEYDLEPAALYPLVLFLLELEHVKNRTQLKHFLDVPLCDAYLTISSTAFE